MDRFICDDCKQELSRSAYYRHKNFPVCPGRKQTSKLSTSKTSPIVTYENDSIDYPADFEESSWENDEERESINSEEGNDDDIVIGGIEIIGEDEVSESGNSDVDNDTIDDSGNNSSHNTTHIEQNENEKEILHDNTLATIDPIINTISHFLLFLQLKFRIPDQAIYYLLLTLKGLFSTLLSLIPGNRFLLQLHRCFPYTLYGLKKTLKTTWKSSITEYVACANCSTLTKLSNYTLPIRRQIQTDTYIPKCSFIEFPNHPQVSRRQKCNSPLFKHKKIGSKYRLVPHKTFLYNSIIESLRKLINNPGMLQLCNKWVNHNAVDDTLNDITDGQMWKDFIIYEGRPFLDLPNNIALALNIDWFNPYKHTQYSIGAVYLTILNLPRTLRYKIENTIIVGLIPGPKEPKRINTFLQPVINEFIQLWHGVDIIESCNSSVPKLRAALLCFVSDIPATRKVCGFPNFNAKFGCSKCLKTFPCERFSGPTDYSGYDRQNWTARTLSYHKSALTEIQACNTITDRKEKQRNYGVHYSELNRLPYFNIIRSHVIDPMHNMYLGTAKHAMKTWREHDIIREDELSIIQQRVDEFNVPYDIGRIPYKIGSNFSGLTADQWMNWTNIYSMYALRDILPPSHMQCWSYFVKASVILRQYTITKDDMELADKYLLKFCEEFQIIYGKEKCSPNMHLHNHLKDCVLDYGPISSFWAFPFERFNGLLESFSKNWMKPEEQILQKLVNLQTMKTTPPEFSVIKELFSMDDCEGSLQQTQVDTHILQQYKNNATCPVESINASRLDIHNILSAQYERYFNDDEVDSLKLVYTKLYPESSFHHVPKCHFVFSDLEVLGEHYLSSKSRSRRSSIVMARWYDSTGLNLTYQVGEIEFFFSHTIGICSLTLEGQPSAKQKKSDHLFAKVNWLANHERPCHFPFPLYLVSTLYSGYSPYTYIPASRLLCRCAVSPKLFLKFDYGEDYAYAIAPCLLANATKYRAT